MNKPTDYGLIFGKSSFVFDGKVFADTDKALIRAQAHDSAIEIENRTALTMARLPESDDFFFDVGRKLLRSFTGWVPGSAWDHAQCTGKDIRLALLAIEEAGE